MRYWKAILSICATAGLADLGLPNALGAARGEMDGRSLLLGGEPKRAAKIFEKAVAAQPNRAALHYWLGRSYAQMADISNPLAAPACSRRAHRSLERAVELDPGNDEYLRELVNFYLDSPGWSPGRLNRAAALLERLGPGEPSAESLHERLLASRKEHRGSVWMLRAILCMPCSIGY